MVVALTTPKSGPDLRADIKGLAGRLKRKAKEAGMALCPAAATGGGRGDRGRSLLTAIRSAAGP